MEYAGLKLTHVSCVALSYVFFVLRGVWMLRAPALLQQYWVRTVPHIVDTGLLASAIALVIITQQYPPAATWLTAKLIALVLYIALGMIALKHGKTKSGRITAWITAQLVFVYIVAVALTRSPLPFVRCLQMQ
jgi:uncharacterized membrane protein SirB2